ncbi:MAG: M43 family zinc metalloprotease, partial [Flavobacteriales bacterium]|nr:M43 family zinc metalloprotease [Flavobacteriales bacterium]
QDYTEEHYGERAGGLKVIPVVFHVIHDYGSENLSKSSIVNSLEFVNQELRGQNGNLSSVIPEFESLIADTEFELRLAKIDANGNCTDGITRTVSDQTYSADEDVKDLINWNDGSRRYLQVWLVNTVGSGAGGYTYLPGVVNRHRNGIIIRSGQLGGSLAHEFGHWLNLKHTWGSGNENGVSCGNDQVSDTPQTIGSLQECNTNQMSCGSLDNVQNHMDYSTCARMFTLGQKARMQSASDSNTGERSTYWSSNNRSATGTNDGYTDVCTPIVEFGLNNESGCEGFEVEFEDLSWNADVDGSWIWSWTFEGGTPATSDEQNPTVTYNTEGVFDVTLTVQNSAGTASESLQNLITVNSANGGIIGPFLEGVEDSDFPDNANQDFEWSIESPGGITWGRSTSASYTDNASVRINLRSISEGAIHSLISPAMDFTNVDPEDAT